MTLSERESSATAVRLFGWLMLGALLAFMVNAILTFWFEFPGVGGLLAGENVTLAVLQLLIWVAALGAAVWLVTSTPGRSLRDDGERVNAINLMLVRMAFWVVLLVGVADLAISFLRVEGLLADVVGGDIAGDLGRSAYRGTYVHGPLVLLGILLGAITRTLGFQWLALMVVVAELLIVLSRFVFSYEQAFMADLVRFWYGALFLFASAYTLYDDGHVRVDLVYAGLSKRAKGLVNSVGAIFLGIALCWTILLIGFGGRNAIVVAPIRLFEVTQAGFGLYVKYFMAGFLAVFAVTMLVQFVSQLFDAVADRRGEPGGHETHPEPL